MRRLPARALLLLLTTALALPIPAALAAPSPAAAPAAPSSAAPAGQLSKQQALDLAVRLGEVPADFRLLFATLRSPDPWRPFAEWSFSWQKKAGDSGENPDGIQVSVDAATGELTGYSHYGAETGSGVRLTREQALETAQRFLKERAPSRAQSVRLYERDMPQPKPPLDQRVTYSFRFVRMVDGIPFPDNYVNIIVGGDGRVMLFDLNWNDRIRFERPATLLPADQAKQRFAEQIRPTLSFWIPWEQEPGSKPSAVLIYDDPFSFYLDAQTGQQLSAAAAPYLKRVAPRPATDRPLPPLNSGDMLGQEEAVQLVKRLFSLNGSYRVSASFNEDGQGGRTAWDLQFTQSGNVSSSRYVSLNAKTGDVIAYSSETQRMAMERASGGKNAKPPLSPDKLADKALDTLRRLAPTAASQMYLTEWEEERLDGKAFRYVYHFRRYVLGVPSAAPAATVTLDAASGELANFFVEPDAAQYPARLPDHKSAEEAKQAWLSEAETELVYFLPPQPPGQENGDPMQTRIARPVYRMLATPSEQPYAYGAQTGEWLNKASGQPIRLHRPEPTDIAGHPAEQELRLMYEYDALSLVDGKILPDRPVTRGEMIAMLVLVLNNGHFYPQKWAAARQATFTDVSASHPYFAAVEAAAANGLLDTSVRTLKPDETITRDELADMLVKALGYGKLAQLDGLFRTDLADAGEATHKGAVAIVTALGIMPAKDNAFRPRATVTRADAAVAFARFLEKWRELAEVRPFR